MAETPNPFAYAPSGPLPPGIRSVMAMESFRPMFSQFWQEVLIALLLADTCEAVRLLMRDSRYGSVAWCLAERYLNQLKRP